MVQEENLEHVKFIECLFLGNKHQIVSSTISMEVGDVLFDVNTDSYNSL